MNSTLKNKVSLQVRVRNLVAGTQKHFSTGSLTVGGATYDGATLVQILTNLGNAIAAADSAKTKWQDALKVGRDENAKAGPVLRAYQRYLVASFGSAPSTLADFGLVPPKAPLPKSTEQKAAAVAKSKATRASRHTMGKVQKQDVTGNVEGVVITPVIAPQPAVAASTGPSAPAQTASPTGSAPHTS
jgi:hypothetical protein